MKGYFSKALFAVLPFFLICFMLFIFGPSELFFSNSAQFEFVYGEFIAETVLTGVLLSLVLACITAFFPETLYRITVSVCCAVAVAGYVQIMFLNRNLDLLGLNPDGASIPVSGMLIGALVWLAIIAAFVFLAVRKKDIVRKVVAFAAVLLLGMQAAALASLFIGADQEDFKRPEGSLVLSGKDQFTVSTGENIVVLVLDFFSNQYVDRILDQYPGAFDFLHDFTSYSNDECVYYGTYPSLAHMITGREVDASLSVNEWTASIWEDPQTRAFFDLVEDSGYRFNFYTPESVYVRGENDMEILDGMIDNVSRQSGDLVVDRKAIARVMTKMSLYRFVPDAMKNLFYVQNSEFSGTVTDPHYIRRHTNAEVYEGLRTEGLHLEDAGNLITFQHFSGAHEFSNDAECNPKEDSTLEETCKGCLVMVEEYLAQLKALGRYDDSTIIITSDHGGENDSQVIFYYKKPGETHDSSPVSTAPISHCELQPTIIEAMGADHSAFGRSVEEILEGETRERTNYVRKQDDAYPSVRNFSEDKEGTQNVYYVYRYTGDYDDLYKKIEQGPDEIVPMKDSFW